MKHFKKIAAAIFAVMTVLAMSVNTLAATITVTGGAEGQDYSAYLIFNVEATTITGGTGYIYYIDYDSQFVDLIKDYADSIDGVSTGKTNGLSLVSTTRTNSSGVVVDTYEVQVNGDYDSSGVAGEFSAKAFAAYLKDAIDNGSYTPTATATATAGTGNIVTASLSANEAGYYFVNTSLGSVGILRTSTENIEIPDKNSGPTPQKEATTINGSTSDGTVKIGDTVGYTVTVTAGTGAVEYNIIVNDTLSEGLTYVDGSVVVTDSNGNTWDLNDDYTVSYTDVLDQYGDPTGEHLLTITLLSSDNGGDYLSLLTSATDKVYIAYSAVINENAASYANSTEGITNDVSLTYGRTSSYTTEEVTEEVDTFRFGIEKTTSAGAQLAGAVFNVYSGTDASITANLLGFVETTGADANYHYYRLATSDDDPSDIVYDLETSTTYTILWLEGLDAGTYTIVETEAPAGYNILNGTITLEIADDGTRTFTYNGTDGMVADQYGNTTFTTAYITIENSSGSTLPTTGGMGTKIFYTLGGILVVGAGILLITKRRMNAAK
ncbi:MAG: isopeptide-forming domain-containing fimbrial protein [Eubacterium sp.]|nr:isopeptide-forming domain-containing fimbrial protein [Eubacterium sp.]